MALPKTFERHIILKKAFARWKNIRPCGMSKALELMKLPPVGQHHRAIDDARNIAKLAPLILLRVEADDIGAVLHYAPAYDATGIVTSQPYPKVIFVDISRRFLF